MSIDRMTDKPWNSVAVPEQRGGHMAVLVMDCDWTGFLRLPGVDVEKPEEVRFMTRVDRQPAVTRTGTQRPDHRLFVERFKAPEFRDTLVTAQSLALRIGQVDMEFPLAIDNAEAFALTVELHAGAEHRVGARAAWGLLESTLLDASQGRNANVAALMKRIGLPLTDAKGTFRGAADLLPGIARAFKANRGRVVVDDAGRALFGFGWDSVSGYMRKVEDYRADNGPLAAQIDWLKERCASAAKPAQ